MKGLHMRWLFLTVLSGCAGATFDGLVVKDGPTIPSLQHCIELQTHVVDFGEVVANTEIAPVSVSMTILCVMESDLLLTLDDPEEAFDVVVEQVDELLFSVQTHTPGSWEGQLLLESQDTNHEGSAAIQLFATVLPEQTEE
jgi:hypothetical protein